MLRVYLDIIGGVPNERAQLRNMEPAPAPGSDGPCVLIFSVRGWQVHLAWETTIAKALQLRGAKTLSVSCDRILPACELRTIVDDFSSTCAWCMAQSKNFFKQSNLPHRWLGELVNSAEVAMYLEKTSDLTLAELESYESNDIRIGSLVRASVNRHLLKGAIDDNRVEVEVYRRFVAAGLSAQSAIEILLQEYKPDTILAMNGAFYAEAILLVDSYPTLTVVGW